MEVCTYNFVSLEKRGNPNLLWSREMVAMNAALIFKNRKQLESTSCTAQK